MGNADLILPNPKIGLVAISMLFGLVAISMLFGMSVNFFLVWQGNKIITGARIYELMPSGDSHSLLTMVKGTESSQL